MEKIHTYEFEVPYTLAKLYVRARVIVLHVKMCKKRIIRLLL